MSLHITRVVRAPPPALGDSPLALVAAGLSSNQWGTLTVPSMTQNLITAGGTDTILSWARAGYASVPTKRLYFYGGTHDSQNITRLIRYIDATNTWEVDQHQAPDPGSLPSSPHHGYKHFTMRESDGKQWIRHYGDATISTRSEDGSWSTITNLPGSLFSGFNVADALEYHPALNSSAGGLMFCTEDRILTGPLVSGTWTTQQQQAGLMGSLHNWSAWNQIDNCVYCGGGNSSSAMYRVNADGSVTSRANTPFTCGTSPNGQGHVMRRTGTRKMIAINDGTGSIREYDTSANTWSSEIDTLPFDPSEGLFFGIPVDHYGCVVFHYISSGNTPSTTMHVWKS